MHIIKFNSDASDYQENILVRFFISIAKGKLQIYIQNIYFVAILHTFFVGFF